MKDSLPEDGHIQIPVPEVDTRPEAIDTVFDATPLLLFADVVRCSGSSNSTVDAPIRVVAITERQNKQESVYLLHWSDSDTFTLLQ